MTEPKKGKIQCTQCQQLAPLKYKKKYEGFKEIGSEYACAFCEHIYSEDHIPWATDAASKVFDANEERRICLYCHHYVVNPWTQKCMIWKKEISATDTCERFTKKKEEEKDLPPFLTHDE